MSYSEKLTIMTIDHFLMDIGDYSPNFFIFKPLSLIIPGWTTQITSRSRIGYKWFRSTINIDLWFPPLMDGLDSSLEYEFWSFLWTGTPISDSNRQAISLDNLFRWTINIHCRISVFGFDCGMKLPWMASMNGIYLTRIYSDERLDLNVCLTISIQ